MRARWIAARAHHQHLHRAALSPHGTIGGIRVSTLETTGLTNTELRALARTLLADRDRWEPLVRADPERRHYELLRRDEDVVVWLISWMHGHDTGYHDHDFSAGAVAVAEGSIREDRLRVGGA